jgi:hypothetical protein
MARRFFDSSRRAVDGKPLLTLASSNWKRERALTELAENFVQWRNEDRARQTEKVVSERLSAY